MDEFFDEERTRKIINNNKDKQIVEVRKIERNGVPKKQTRKKNRLGVHL